MAYQAYNRHPSKDRSGHARLSRHPASWELDRAFNMGRRYQQNVDSVRNHLQDSQPRSLMVTPVIPAQPQRWAATDPFTNSPHHFSTLVQGQPNPFSLLPEAHSQQRLISSDATQTPNVSFQYGPDIPSLTSVTGPFRRIEDVTHSTEGSTEDAVTMQRAQCPPPFQEVSVALREIVEPNNAVLQAHTRVAGLRTAMNQATDSIAAQTSRGSKRRNPVATVSDVTRRPD